MKRIALSILALALATLACATGPTTPRPPLFPSATPDWTQTPYLVEVTRPVTVEITNTPEPTRPAARLCVSAQVAVHLRPSPSTENYPVGQLPNGAVLTDLGGRDGKWLFVSYGDMQGWVYSDYVGDC